MSTPRKLITEADVLAALRAGQSSIPIAPNTLITPLARDTAREHGIRWVPVQPESPTCDAQQHTSTHQIVIGSDHGGYEYKELLKPFIKQLGWQVIDVGTDTPQSCDYPDFAYAVARTVALHHADFGIMIEGAGIGSSIVCNKVPGIRAACAYNEFTAWNARAHNNANVLTLGSRSLGIEVCKRIVQTFLSTSFEGGRHQRRVQKIIDIERMLLKDI